MFTLPAAGLLGGLAFWTANSIGVAVVAVAEVAFAATMLWTRGLSDPDDKVETRVTDPQGVEPPAHDPGLP